MYEALFRCLIILYQHIDFNENWYVHLAEVGGTHLHRTFGDTIQWPHTIYIVVLKMCSYF